MLLGVPVRKWKKYPPVLKEKALREDVPTPTKNSTED
jgi:hypothetical protein